MHTGGSLPEGISMHSTAFPLGESSGNLQSLGFESRDGIENETPYLKRESRFPIPDIKLGSNDGADHAIRRELKVEPPIPCQTTTLYDPKRPFLHNPKYLEYMGRQRQEFGKDGKPVWSDEIETAFQDGDLLIKPTRLSGDHGPSDGRKYYHNSIEHLVKQQKATRHRARRYPLQRHRYDLADQENDCDTDFNDTMLDFIQLWHMKFEMWVTLPDDPEHALHKYTRLQTATESSTPVPLEEVVDWRTSFPHLQNSMKEWSASTPGEIILLNVSFQLMDNFPPRRSKLGIGFELEFGANDRNLSHSTRQEMMNCDWHSIIFIYENGEQIREPMAERCIVSDQAQLRPIFQSKWWASTFTYLTEIKRVAEDSKDPATIEAANDRVYKFFQSLTIMQEVWGTPEGELGNPLAKRIAILLWKFSEAHAGFVGTATWQKLIAPPECFATNSPLACELGLPSLEMDAMVPAEPSHDTFVDDNFFFKEPGVWNLHRPQIEDDIEIDPEGFLSFKPLETPDFGQTAAAFTNPAGVEADFDHLHGTSNHYSFGVQAQSELGVHSHNDETMEANIFEIPHLTKEGTDLSDTIYEMLDQISGNPISPVKTHGPPLARFDPKYHTVLQEQLGIDEMRQTHVQGAENESCLGSEQRHSQSPLVKSEIDESGVHPDAMDLAPSHHDSWTEVDDHDQVLRSALLAVSSTDVVDNSQSSNNPHSPNQDQYIMSQQSQTPHWDSPLTFRPCLQSHHSFPGLDYHPVAHDDFVLLGHPQALVSQERCLQSLLAGEEGHLETESHTVQACGTTSTRHQSEPYNAPCPITELDPFHVEPRHGSQTHDSSFQDDSLSHLPQSGLFPGHASDPQSRARTLVPQDQTPVFGGVGQIDEGYPEVKMEDVAI